MREDRVHLFEGFTGQGPAPHSCLECKEITNILPREPGKGVLLPSLPPDADPEFAEDLPEQLAVRCTKGRPVDSLGASYLLHRILDRLFLSELEPPPAQLIITGTGHT